MKNSIKFFLSGTLAATLIFFVFAFTAKQNTNKKYLTIRVVEANAGYVNQMIQITDENSEG